MLVPKARSLCNLLPLLSLFAGLALVATPVQAQFQDLLKSAGGKPAAKSAAEFHFELNRGKSADEAVLTISAKIPPGHYIRSMTDEGAATRLVIKQKQGLEAVDLLPKADHEPKRERDPDLEMNVEKYLDKVTWTQRYRLLPGTKPADVVLGGQISYQICNDRQCIPGKSPPFELHLAAAAAHEEEDEPVTPKSTGSENVDPVEPAVAPGADDGEKATTTTPDRESAKPNVTAAPTQTVGYEKSQGLFLFLTAAVLAGFAALLTPCVFPMIPITVSFFQKQSEKQHHRPVTMATVYCLGIIGTFTGLGMLMSALFGAASLTTLANNPWLNLFIAAVLIFFAFNLLGMFEIRMPGWLLTYTANQEGRGGFIGVLFMALTFTLTSFTCTFAFAGGLLAAAANGDRLWPALGLLAFSAAFSLPFFFLALFPTLMQKLPKSGGWMNVAKVVMGLVELGAAFKFLSVADLKWHPVAWIFDYELVLSAWMIISITGGMYLLGMFRLPHDVQTEHIGVMRFVSAMSFLGLAAYLAVGLYAVDKPSGKVWENILAFAPPKFSSSNESFGPALEHGGVKYALDYQRAIEYAAKQNKPVFIDFTGVNCANCRKMEKGPLSRPEITDRLKNFVCVQVFADRVPVITDDVEAERLLAANLKLQEWFGDNSLPSYAVIPADPNIAADPAAEKVLSAAVGYNPNEEEFAQFLDNGFSRWKQWLAHQGANRLLGHR